jgi:hypothetical protein
MKITYRKAMKKYHHMAYTIDRYSNCGNYLISKKCDSNLYYIYFSGFFIELEKIGMKNEFKTLKAAKQAIQKHRNNRKQ